MKPKVYLDYAAATPLDPQVLAAMKPFFSDKFYNPSATYLDARAAKRDLSSARAKIAGLLGARPPEIIFTAGATEANNLAIQGVIRAYPKGEVLVSAVEHDSVLEVAKQFKHKLLPVDGQGLLRLSQLEKLVSDKTVIVSLILVNNELGTIQPVNEVAKILNKLSIKRQAAGNRLPLYLHTDAAQAGSYLDMHVSRLGVDLMSFNGDKIYGPKQSAALYVKTGTDLKPLMFGGGHEQGLRPGTENLAAAAGLAAALEMAQASRRAEARRISQLRWYFINGLDRLESEITINGSAKHSAPHVLSVTFAGVDNERLMMELDEAGVICGVGSACSASNDLPSRVLSAIGLSNEQARATLRFSLGRQTSQKDIEYALDWLVKLTAVNR
jgi:cysteine desulfurase